jgi:hypothetical protein
VTFPATAVAVMAAMAVVAVMAVTAPVTVKVVKNVEAPEIESAPPEWIGNPVVEVIIGPGRRVLSYDRRSIVGVVAIDIG